MSKIFVISILMYIEESKNILDIGNASKIFVSLFKLFVKKTLNPSQRDQRFRLYSTNNNL